MVNFSSISASFSSFSIPRPDFRAGYDKVTKSASECLGNLSFSSIKNSKWTYVVLVGAAVVGAIYYVFSKKIANIKQAGETEIARLNTEINNVQIELVAAQTKPREAEPLLSQQPEQGPDATRLQEERDQAHVEARKLRQILELFHKVAEAPTQSHVQLLVKQQDLKEEIGHLQSILEAKESQIAKIAPGTPAKPPRGDFKTIEQYKDELGEKQAALVSLEEDIAALEARILPNGSPVASGQADAVDPQLTQLRLEMAALEGAMKTLKAENAALQQGIEVLQAQEKDRNAAAASEPCTLPVKEGLDALKQEMDKVGGALEGRLQSAELAFIQGHQEFFLALHALVQKGGGKAGNLLNCFNEFPQPIKDAIAKLAQTDESQA